MNNEIQPSDPNSKDFENQPITSDSFFQKYFVKKGYAIRDRFFSVGSCQP